METRNKILITIGVVLLILIISGSVYFSWFYEPKNAYDVVMDVKGIGGNVINELKESELEEVKKEPTFEETIREIEKNKPKFNLTIQPNLVPEYKDYAELEEAKIQKIVGRLKLDEKVHPATIELTEKDIERLKNYDTPEVGAYIGFEEYNKKFKDDAESWVKDINPVSFPFFKGAKVEWFTESRLVYKNAIGQRGIRGILRLKYFDENNQFKAEANKVYEIDTEIVVSNTDNYDNTTSLKLNKILYLSNLREVE